jgi:deoxyinosine 3'endonuclease (endonuclease V)
LIVTVTDPVGVHVDGATADTVIVTVTGAQHTDGLGAAVIVVVVLALPTVGVNDPEEVLKQLSPP